jgi:hypothetical protein
MIFYYSYGAAFIGMVVAAVYVICSFSQTNPDRLSLACMEVHWLPFPVICPDPTHLQSLASRPSVTTQVITIVGISSIR